MNLTRTVALGFPVALPLAFLATWVAGRWRLGHWPRPSLDDPKDLGIWVTVPHTVTGVLLMVGMPLFVGAVAGLVWRAYRDPAQRGPILRCAIVALGAMAASIAVLRWDPWGVVHWYFD